jgi:uncharacterized protein YciI
MAEWIYFLHPPRDDFAATISDDEERKFDEHFEYLKDLLAQGTLILSGPTLGTVNTGIAIFRAPDEATAEKIMRADPVVRDGVVRGELRGYRVSLVEDLRTET